METRSAKKRKLLRLDDNNGDGIDRISQLPDNLLHHILFLLPIKTMAQTSVLSRRWSYLWSTIPDLDFTDHDVSISYTKTPIYSRNSRTDPISQVLNFRNKFSNTTNSDIRTLRFRTTTPVAFSRLNQVIRRAIRCNVQELDLDVVADDYINFPRSVMLSESLRVLIMRSRSAAFRLPPDLSVMKSGFRSLVSFSLTNVVLLDDDQNLASNSLVDLFSELSFPQMRKLRLERCLGLKQLRISCQALKELDLKYCYDLKGLDICSPKLERLGVESCFGDDNDDGEMISTWVKIDAPRLKFLDWEDNVVTDTCSLVNLSNLSLASLSFFHDFYHENMSVSKVQGLSNFLTGLACVRRLKFDESTVMILSNNHYFGVLELNPFSNLRMLELHTDVKRNIGPGLASVFSNSPVLQTLILKFIIKIEERRKWESDPWEVQSSSVEELYWESQAETLKPFLHHLKIVTIHGLFTSEKEVILAKFLLKHGKALQEMTLYTKKYISNARNSRRRQEIIRSQLMGFSWASSNAKIKIR